MFALGLNIKSHTSPLPDCFELDAQKLRAPSLASHDPFRNSSALFVDRAGQS